MKDPVRWAVTERVMPPWLAADGCAEYLHNRSLSDEQIATIAGWVDAGAPAGDPADAPDTPGDPPGTGLSRIDLTLAMPEPYTPQNEPDDYRCFLLDWPEQTTMYVTGIGLNPGVPEILHHMIAFLATPDVVADFEAMDAAEPGPGYACYGGPGGQERPLWIGGWAPGVQGIENAPGTGVEVPPGSKVILQLHYNTSYAPPSPDRTELLFKLDAAVEKRAGTMPWVNPMWVLGGEMTIPAHSTDVTHSVTNDPTQWVEIFTGGQFQNGQPLTLYSAGLHMHTLGKRGLIRIDRQDGSTECMLDIPRWDFHWQGGYSFATPKQINPGDKIHMECTWDNPTDQDVNWGEGTADEMCLGIFYITQ
jgi:hypothetical protein